MIRNNSPTTKRKRSEFHDPDYPAAEKEQGDVPGTIKRKWDESLTPNVPNKEVFRFHKLHDIISREFQTEINYKEKQLEIINKRLLYANEFLDQLRYGIVAKYYKKQQISLTKADVDKIRGTTLFDDEKGGAQMPMHPALKKIVGSKQIQSVECLKRVCRERTAANNARQTIRARSSVQLREERRMKQLIKAKGIVIDHSHEEDDKKRNLCIIEQNVESPQSLAKASSSKTFVNALNSSRLNNKEKLMVVVANTSQYIGNDIENSQGKLNELPIIYKWLVYVRLKDNNDQIEKYVKKVRFYLHHSYRPNDIIDVCSPPFQIARRGWGEFPMRIQLFFNEIFQQKPIQLVHNIVLDKKLSGIHTLGAETIVEIWLRTIKSKKTSANHNEATNQSSTEKISSKLEETTSTSLGEEEEAVSKTEATVFMDEKQTSNNSNIETGLTNSTTQSVNTTNDSLAKIQSIPQTFVLQKSYILDNKNTQSSVIANKCQNISTIKNLNTKQPKQTYNGNLCNDNIPIQSTGNPISNACLTKYATNNVFKNSSLAQESCKEFMQKKIVRLVNTQGKTKYIEMLVATNILPKSTSDSKPKIQPIKAASSAQPSFPYIKPLNIVSTTVEPVRIGSTPVTLKHSISSHKPAHNQISETLHCDKTQSPYIQNFGNAKCTTVLSSQQTNPKIVFQKEGKLYIVDPIQMRLKQEQRKQVSLLKPQLSLLKQNMNRSKEHCKSRLNEMSVTQRDHDYTAATSKTTALSINSQRQRTIRLGQFTEMRDKQERFIVEKKFLCTNFENMRSAIEYLLRRIPIISNNQIPEISLPFTCGTLYSFQNLTAFKQRCYEWLRAKYFARLIRHHPKLKELSHSCREAFWSTREIAKFSDQYSWLPNKKSIAQTIPDFGDPEKRDFTALVSNELLLERQLQNGTITPHDKISKWMEQLWVHQQLYKMNTLENNFIVVDDNVKWANYVENTNSSQNFDNTSKMSGNAQIFQDIQQEFSLRPPKYLENENEIVTNACRELGICLEPEIIETEKLCASSNVVLAQCLRVFIDKLLRYSLAIKRKNISVPGASDSCTKSGTDTHVITIKDIRKVIVESQEFHFLSNFYMGVYKSDDLETTNLGLLKTEK